MRWFHWRETGHDGRVGFATPGVLVAKPPNRGCPDRMLDVRQDPPTPSVPRDVKIPTLNGMSQRESHGGDFGRERLEPQRQTARRRAAELFAQGVVQAEVARHLGIVRSTASAWHRLWREGGEQALLRERKGGRPPKLESRDLSEVHRALMSSPREAGLFTDRWSLHAVVALVHRITGVAYHPRHVTRVLRRQGWIVPPVGRDAAHAFRQMPVIDPEGNVVGLQGTR